MKKSRLVIDYDYDFFLAGIVTSSTGYKLAWEINKHLGAHLVKQANLVVGFKDHTERSFAYYAQEPDTNRLKLFRNKALESENGKLLVPEFPELDFIILRRASDEKMSDGDFVAQLRLIRIIQIIVPLALKTLKSKANFIF